MSSSSNTCRACPAPLIWARMPTGKGNPLDREELTAEQVRQDHRGVVAYDPYTRKGLSINKDNRELLDEYASQGMRFHMSHWATCPARRQIRRETDAGDVTECPVDGCRLLHPRSMLMCRTHWRNLPKGLRDELWRAHNDEGVLSDAYRRARDACIAHAEGR